LDLDYAVEAGTEDAESLALDHFGLAIKSAEARERTCVQIGTVIDTHQGLSALSTL
jgi:hypothetical protein